MKSALLKLYRLKYKLPQPIAMATFTWTHYESIIVKLSYDQFTGIGEATPFSEMTGEPFDYVVAQLNSARMLDINPNKEFDFFYNQLATNIRSCHAQAALDAAFHDLVGKIRNQPVYRLFANEINLTQNSITLPILPLEELRILAGSIRDKYPHAKLIKIKISNESNNTEMAKVIKSIFSRDVSFVIDPNQSFKNSSEAIIELRKIQTILGDVIAIEQPVDKLDYQGLLDIKNNLTGTRIYADESVVNIKDLNTMIKMNAVDGINIKIQKAGGIANARQMAQIAEKAGLKIMVGCMMEEALGVAAGVHFAVSTPNVSFTDLDSDLFLNQDASKSIFSISPFVNGIRLPAEKSGLGINFQKDMIENTSEEDLVYEEIW